MTLLNIWLEREHAMVGVDTATSFTRPDGSPLEVEGYADGASFDITKLVPIAHLNAVLSARGIAAFLPQVFFRIQMQPFDSVDDVFEQMLPMLDQCFVGLEHIAAQQGVLADPRQEVVLVGWSARQARMRGMYYVQHTVEAGFEGNEIDEVLICPWDDDAQGCPEDPVDRDAMLRLMRAQVADARERHPAVAAGGRFVVAEITPLSINVRAY